MVIQDQFKDGIIKEKIKITKALLKSCELLGSLKVKTYGNQQPLIEVQRLSVMNVAEYTQVSGSARQLLLMLL